MTTTKMRQQVEEYLNHADERILKAVYAMLKEYEDTPASKTTPNDEQYKELEEKFNQLALKWKKETGVYSTTIHKAANANYLDIIGMGEAVVPCILKDLKRESNYWFAALKAITKENPVPREDMGNIEKMRKAWLKWGEERKLI